MQKFTPVALVLIPDLHALLTRQLYYTNCRETVIEEGYIVINPLTFLEYEGTVTFEYVISIKDCLNAIYVFTDLPNSRLIYRLRKELPENMFVERHLEEDKLKLMSANCDSLLVEATERAKNYFGIEIRVQELMSKTRKREIVMTRQFLMKKIKDNTKMSLASIGMVCGNKDHATVLHALKTIETTFGMMKSYCEFWGIKVKEPDTKKEVQEVEKNIDVVTEQSVIAELEMRKPPSESFKNPYADVVPHSSEYSGYREHSI